MLGNKYNIGVDARAEWKALEWTTEPPTQAGWYWVQREKNGEKWVHLNWCAAGYSYFDNKEILTTHWLGPLPVPEPPEEDNPDKWSEISDRTASQMDSEGE